MHKNFWRLDEKLLIEVIFEKHTCGARVDKIKSTFHFILLCKVLISTTNNFSF